MPSKKFFDVSCTRHLESEGSHIEYLEGLIENCALLTLESTWPIIFPRCAANIEVAYSENLLIGLRKRAHAAICFWLHTIMWGACEPYSRLLIIWPVPLTSVFHDRFPQSLKLQPVIAASSWKHGFNSSVDVCFVQGYLYGHGRSNEFNEFHES